MRKIAKQVTQVTLATLGGLLLAGQIFAGALSVRIEQPKSPTNQNDFTVNFVSLDLSPSPAAETATCFKKAPSDGGFSQMGGTIAISAGGNSGNCQTGSSVIVDNGTYQFYVTVTNGSETVTSDTVSVNFNNSGPGTPTNWSKEKTSDNTYKIHFRTADDAGKTVKVEIYRSDQTSFNTDSGTRVGSVSVGSNTDVDFTNTIPDTSKTYYYAVRAFDSAGNGSGVLGDHVTTTTTVVTTLTPVQGAIPVSGGGGAGGAVLGTGTAGESAGVTGATGTEGTVLGENVSPTTTPPTPAGGFWSFLGPLSGHPWIVGGGLVAILGLVIYIVFL